MTTATMLGQYRLVECIGEGGMGVVHRALTDDGSAVAVKVLRDHVAADPHARARLAREVGTLRRVRHPRVAQVLDADIQCPTPYLVTEFIDGPSLEQRVLDGGPLSRAELVRLGSGLGQALAAIHAVCVVHRDLKPANVLLNRAGEPVVIDFGIAQAADECRLTQAGMVMGTPGYLAPELLERGVCGPAGDWWGWGATVAFAATGRHPFGSGPWPAIQDRVRRGACDLDGAPPELAEVLAALLGPDPAHRPVPAQIRGAVESLGRAVTASLPAIAGRTEVIHTPPTTVHKPDLATDVVSTDVVDRPSSAPLRYTSAPEIPEPAPEYLMPQGPQYHMPPPPQEFEPPTHQYPPVPVLPEQAYGPDYGSHPEPPPPAGQAMKWFTGESRSGVIATLVLAMCCCAIWLPWTTVYTVAGFQVIARTTSRCMQQLWRRRQERGARGSDAALVALSAPWHALVSVFSSLWFSLLPLLVAVPVALLTKWVLALDALWYASPVSLITAALAGGWMLWWGPGGRSMRYGTRQIARAVTPNDRATWVVVSVFVLLAVSAVLVAGGHGWLPGDPPGLRPSKSWLPW